MSGEDSPRTGRLGGIITVFVVGASAVGVIGWYISVNRGGPKIDPTGFDLSEVQETRRALPSAAGAGAPAAAASGLTMMKGGEGVTVGDSTPPSGSAAKTAPAKGGDAKAQAHAGFTEQARKHEDDVRRFAERMTNKYPLIRQYGKDWMSHPDLKKLNDDYMRNHDPVAFIMGLAKAPSLGGMVKQYAGKPEIVQFITQGMKEAPADLTASAMDVLTNDSTVKGLIGNIVSGLGLPPSVTAMIGGSGGAIDENKVMSDIVNSPAARAAMQQQGSQAPPVNLSGSH
ncbi:MAG: hypothetical protein ACHQ49_04205 [Elusimicrobiota bacterium]